MGLLKVSLLVDHGQHVQNIPGRIIHQATATSRGEGTTDAKGARIIADKARMRTDLTAVHSGDHISANLRLSTARRLDLIYDTVGQSTGSTRPGLSIFPRDSGDSTTRSTGLR